MTDRSLWASGELSSWRNALDDYASVIARQNAKSLPDLDQWYRQTLPESIAERRKPHVTLPELERLTQWKMARGIWRGRNLALVRSNDPDLVVRTSEAALATIPHPTAPIAELSKLAGVGPATASAVAAAASPNLYPFFDELIAGQIPGLGAIAYTLGYYARYAAALRERAERLGAGWTPVMVERALWANVGGKAGVRG